MPSINPTLPVDGDEVTAASVNGPLTAIIAVINGGLDENNLADGAVTQPKVAPGAAGYLMANVVLSGTYSLTPSFTDVPGLLSTVNVLNTSHSVEVLLRVDAQNDAVGFTSGDFQVSITEDGNNLADTVFHLPSGGLHYGFVLFSISNPGVGNHQYKARVAQINGTGTIYLNRGDMAIKAV